jgi:NAD/NADP transhydrogenase alpha subunit
VKRGHRVFVQAGAGTGSSYSDEAYLAMGAEILPDGEPCSLVLGWAVCVPEMAGKISHGICEPCSLRWMETFSNQKPTK